MINKLYVKTKEFLNENYKLLCILGILFVLFTIPMPYYIDTPGGAIKVNDKFTIKESYQSKGAFHLAYVAEKKATIPILLYAYFQKDWKILKKEEIKYDNETIKDVNFRDRLLMTESYGNAIEVAYQKANKKVEKRKENIYVTYIDEQAQTNLEIGEQILACNKKNITSKAQILSIIQSKQEGEKVIFLVKKENKHYEKEAKIIKEKGISKVGIMINVEKDLKTDPEIKLHTKKTESGPSGGLMLSLSIYDALTKEDITKGRKIVGTGTIDEKGNVGEIGGVAFKLKGAVKEKADIFIVPKGENYQEALKIKKERNYKIEIVAVSTFDEALTYLTK